MKPEKDEKGRIFAPWLDRWVWPEDWPDVELQGAPEILRQYTEARDELIELEDRMDYLKRKLEAASQEVSRRQIKSNEGTA